MSWQKIKYFIPNLFTATSLIIALFALKFIYSGNFVSASWFIAISMILDGLDGKIARLLEAQSKFGAQFDTLTDFVAFGIVPGLLVYEFVLVKFGLIGSITTIIYILCGGYRLTRFSLKNHRSNVKQSFIGLPIPAAAGTIASAIIFNQYLWKKIRSAESFMVITLVVAFLMISKIEYLPLDKGNKLSKESKFFLIMAVLSLVIAIKYSYLIFMIWIMVYIFYGIIRHFILKNKK